MPNPPRTTTAGRVFNDLRNRAQREGRNTDELLVFYVLERFLFRLSASRFADRFVLKGGLLLAAFDARRPTRDGDLLAHVDRDQRGVLDCIRHITAIDYDDGLIFQPDQARAQTIRENDVYAGVRVSTPAKLGAAEIKLVLDISFGDPVTPNTLEIEYPQLLSGDTFDLHAYPIETVLAEKIITMIALGDLNTRERDWADVWRLTSRHDVAGASLRSAIEQTAAHRQITLRPLSDVIETLPERRTRAYQAWRRKQSVDRDTYPTTFAEIVTSVTAFADPILHDSAPSATWSSRTRAWR